MKIGGFSLKLTHHFKDNLSEIPIPDDFLSHRADMMSLTLICMIKFLDHSHWHRTFMNQGVIERIEKEIKSLIECPTLFRNIFHLFDETFKDICHCLVGVH